MEPAANTGSRQGNKHNNTYTHSHIDNHKQTSNKQTQGTSKGPGRGQSPGARPEKQEMGDGQNGGSLRSHVEAPTREMFTRLVFARQTVAPPQL